MRHRECEILVMCGGDALEEYNVVVDGNIIECYIASEPGKIFEIKLSNHSSTFPISLGTTVDGRRFPSRTMVESGERDVTLKCQDGIRTKSLFFTEIQTTDDRNVATNVTNPNLIGLIEISCVRMQGYQVVPWTPSTSTEIVDFGPIHEKLKKCGMHCVSFGASQLCQGNAVHVKSQYIDELSAPYVVFRFRYKPRAFLQAQGIIEVDSNEGEDGDDDGSEDYLDMLKAKQQALQRKFDRAKMRRARGEPTPIRVGLFNGGVIDLTDD